MEPLRLYRKRYIPNEIVDLKEDEIVYRDDSVLITQWKVLHPKPNFSHGCSCYFLDKGWKVSKFLNEKGELVYYYCDIIDTEYRETENVYIFTDLLADVIVERDGFVKVVDLAEIADALEAGILSEREARLALRRLDALLEVIYSGDFSALLHKLEGRGIDGTKDTHWA